MSSLFEIGFSLRLLPLIISFFFVLMTRSIFSVLAVFFFSWLWEFPRVSILSTKSQVINHFPEVSAKSSGRSGKVVVSLSLLHYEIVDNDEQKGDRDSPPPKESSDDLKVFSQISINIYCTLEIGIKGYRGINLWFGIPFCSQYTRKRWRFGSNLSIPICDISSVHKVQIFSGCSFVTAYVAYISGMILHVLNQTLLSLF